MKTVIFDWTKSQSAKSSSIGAVYCKSAIAMIEMIM